MQMSLIELPNPLDLTVGVDFFKTLPKVPGVYRMYGDCGRLLYVGKAKNLRMRLMSYRRVKLGKGSAKSLRLVHQVSKIEWQECASEEDALLTENDLLRTHKPPFNVVNIAPEKHFYFVVKVGGTLDSNFSGQIDGSRVSGTFEFSLASEVEGAVFGAFKGLATCHRAFFALKRILWAITQDSTTEPFRYPFDLIRKQKLTPYFFTLPKAHLNLLAGYLHGFKDGPIALECDLVAHARAHLARFTADQFHKLWFAKDLDILNQFFAQGPLRNRRLKSFSTTDSPIIGQAQLDDLMVLSSVANSTKSVKYG